MLLNLFHPTPVMRQDRPALRAFYWILAVVTAAAQVLCALGSGSAATANPMPDWVNNTANLLNLCIAVLVLIPRTRLLGALAAALMMILSMITNAQVDGFDYFLKVLPFDLGALALAAVLAWHHRDDFWA
jgi:hypothetical protein